MPNALNSILWFIAIVVMIPVALWLFKRTPMGGATTQGVIRQIAALPIAQHQRIVTIEVGSGDDRRWLVLGVTSHSITTLHTMMPGVELPVATPLLPQQAFAQLMSKFKHDKEA